MTVLETWRFRRMNFLEFYKVISEDSESEMMQHKKCKDLTTNFHGGKVQVETRCLFKLFGREHEGS